MISFAALAAGEKAILGQERWKPEPFQSIAVNLHEAQTELLRLIVGGSLWERDRAMARMMIRELEQMKAGYR